MRQFLTHSGYQVREAADGAEAIDRLGEPVSLMLSDIEMPRLDGHALARWMRDNQPGTPILLMSGNPFAHPTIAKPFDLKKLCRLIASIVHRSACL